AAVSLHDKTREAELITTYGKAAPVQTLRYPLAGSPAGWVADHQRPLRVARLTPDEWPTAWAIAERLSGAPTPRALLLRPLWVHGQVAGSLEVGWEPGHGIGEQEELLLEAIAVPAAIALTNAQLSQEKESALHALQETQGANFKGKMYQNTRQ